MSSVRWEGVIGLFFTLFIFLNEMSFPTSGNGEEETCRRKTRTGSRWIYLRFFLIGLVANQAIQLVVNSLGAHPKPTTTTTTSTIGGFRRALEEAHNDDAVQNYGEGGGSSSSSHESKIEHLEEDVSVWQQNVQI